jgi:molybdopterin converting factor subunit 1
MSKVTRKLTVEYFAVLREQAGKDSENIETNAETADELFGELESRYGFPTLNSMKVAINDEFSSWNAPLSDGDTVVFIPPVAGG